MSELPKMELCADCGKICPKVLAKQAALGHAQGVQFVPLAMPGGLFSSLFGGRPPGNPKTAWLREPIYTKSRPLTAEGLRTRFQEDGKRAHHRVCRYLVCPVPFLDYANCSKCNVALTEDDVFWKSIYRKKDQ